MNRRPTASTMARTIACPAWLALPHFDEPAGEAAEWGAVAGEYATRAAVELSGSFSAGSKAFAERLVAIDIQQLRDRLMVEHYAWRREVAFRYHTISESAQELGSDMGRSYGQLLDDMIAGAADLFWHGGGRGWIVDIKTGRETQPADENAQLATLALMAARAHQLERVDVTLAYLKDDGSWWFDDATLDAIDLDCFAYALKEANERVLAAQATPAPSVKTGDHCKYCPALRGCPAHTSLVRSLESDVAAHTSGEITPQVAASGWKWLEKAERLTAAFREQLEGYARRCPIDLGNGKVVTEVETEREYVNASVAASALPKDVADLAIKPACSKDAITKACKQTGKDPKTVLSQLRSAGGIDVKVTKSIKEVKR